LDLWEVGWVESLRQLSQWPSLKEYCRATGDAVLFTEVYSRLGEWNLLGEVLQSPIPSVSLETQRNFSSRLLMVEVYLQNSAGVNPSNGGGDSNSVLEDVSSMWLRSWQALPPFACGAHYALLSSAQRVREMHESIVVCQGVERCVRIQGGGLDLKQVLCTWRDRLPNKWDGVLNWEPLLLWREHLFKFITRTLGSAQIEDTSRAHVQDSNWTLLKLAHVARKLGLKNLCSNTLDKVNVAPPPPPGVNTFSPEITTDNFTYSKERIALYSPEKSAMGAAQGAMRRALFALEVEHMRGGGGGGPPPTSTPTLPLYPPTETPTFLKGLSLTHEVDMFAYSYSPYYISKILAMKGGLYEALGPSSWPSAYESYASSLSQCYGNEKGWLHWGIFLERLYHCLRVECSLPESVIASGAVVPPPSSTVSLLPPQATTGGESGEEREAGHPVPLASPPLPIHALVSLNPVIQTAELVAKFVGAGGSPRDNPEGGSGDGSKGGMSVEGAPAEEPLHT